MYTRWERAADEADWLRRALDHVGAAERAALAADGVFRIVLAGGETPRRVYAALAAQAHAWGRWQVWFGDERCLPAEDPQRNSRMVRSALLERVPIPPEAVHVIPAELGPLPAAQSYRRALAGVEDFHLVLLGLGEDGHTASLFPGHDWGEAEDAPDALAVFAAPKPPPERVSLSARRLSRARQVLFLVTGRGKRAAVEAWRRGESLPAAAIRPAGGVDVLLDDLAWSEPC